MVGFGHTGNINPIQRREGNVPHKRILHETYTPRYTIICDVYCNKNQEFDCFNSFILSSVSLRPTSEYWQMWANLNEVNSGNAWNNFDLVCSLDPRAILFCTNCWHYTLEDFFLCLTVMPETWLCKWKILKLLLIVLITFWHLKFFRTTNSWLLTKVWTMLCYVFEWVSDTQQIKTCFQVLILSFLDLPNFHFFIFRVFLIDPNFYS